MIPEERQSAVAHALRTAFGTTEYEDLRPLFRRYAAVTKVYPRNDDLVASHNDVKPENIVFDGDRVWLVDWEVAFLNDR
jgi:thiamine kinase-like enzyme